jgi:ubiquinone/menaquinone biosynthesis C-methylase UbiE
MTVNPDRLISMAAGFQYSKILLTANELGIFKVVGEGARTSDEVAGALYLDREATRLLLGALVGLGLCNYKAGKFTNAPDVKKYLVRESEESMSCITSHMNHMYESWQDLDGIIRKGRPKKVAPPKILLDRKRNRDFICGMFEIGMPTARMLADKIDLKGVRKMADIGGGPAHYPIAFAGKKPDISFVVADYPNTIRVARQYVKKHKLEKRVKLVECEFFDVKDLGIGDDFDMALLSQVLHAASDDKCAELLKKTYRVLRPGGRIVINENALNKDGMSPPPPLIFAINMLVQNAGRTFTVAEISSWLKEAGFTGIKSRRLHERSVIVEARK